ASRHTSSGPSVNTTGTQKARPKNRGKARRYEDKTAGRDTGVPRKKSSVFFGPGRDNAAHAGVSDELAHVLVGMNDDAQVPAVHGGIAIGDVNLALEIFRRDRQMGLFHGVERALEPVDDLVFCCD